MKGDRNDFDALQSQLRGSGFDVVYDINGREAVQVAPLLDALPDLEQYIYCSSAGVYLKSYLMPHRCALLPPPSSPPPSSPPPDPWRGATAALHSCGASCRGCGAPARCL